MKTLKIDLEKLAAQYGIDDLSSAYTDEEDGTAKTLILEGESKK